MKPSQLSSLLAVAIQAREPVLITGAPGIGKSDIVAQAAQTAGAEVVYFHGVTSDPTDIKGMPWITGHNGETKADFVPFGDLLRLIKPSGPTLAFLDDLGQAPPLVQASFMQAVQARRVGEHKISDQVVFVAATNRKQDKAAVAGILEPVKSRFTIVSLEPDLDDWCRWALNAGVPVEVVAFCRFRPECIVDYKPTADLTNSASPRTIHAAARWIGKGLPAALEFDVLAGTIGEGRAAELAGFLKVWRSLPNIDQILLNPDTAPVPNEEPATLYALSGLLARRATQGNFGAMVRYIGRLPRDHAVLTMKMATQKAPEVMQTQGFIQWSVNNQDVLL